MRSQSGDVQMTPLSLGPSEYAGSRAGMWTHRIPQGSDYDLQPTSLSPC